MCVCVWLLIPILHILLKAQFMYCNIFYSFKYGPNPCNILEKLRECSLESMSWVGQGTLVVP